MGADTISELDDDNIVDARMIIRPYEYKPGHVSAYLKTLFVKVDGKIHREDDTFEDIYWLFQDGFGGLFPLKHAKKDQRKVEIWYQLQNWLMENYEFWGKKWEKGYKMAKNVTFCNQNVTFKNALFKPFFILFYLKVTKLQKNINSIYFQF